MFFIGEDAIQFDFYKAELRPRHRELLSRIAGVLLTAKGYSIYVYGHTDDVGAESYNLNLSERRDNTVRDYLIDAGVSPDIISARGYGKSSPRVAGTTDEARPCSAAGPCCHAHLLIGKVPHSIHEHSINDPRLAIIAPRTRNKETS